MQRLVEGVEVLPNPLDVLRGLALEVQDLALRDVVVHRHRRGGVRSHRRLWPHEHRDERAGGLIEARPHKFLDGFHVLRHGGELLVAPEVLEDELAQLRREALDEPVVVVVSQLDRVARKLHLHITPHAPLLALVLEFLRRAWHWLGEVFRLGLLLGVRRPGRRLRGLFGHLGHHLLGHGYQGRQLLLLPLPLLLLRALAGLSLWHGDDDRHVPPTNVHSLQVLA
mmetsp:Transcript_33763/g.94859  ORF Transcript_33763/g.94859 Transcript_33763/m.94859 type:complete len:225 (+) Transcript_33763:1354-2028(+)